MFSVSWRRTRRRDVAVSMLWLVSQESSYYSLRIETGDKMSRINGAAIFGTIICMLFVRDNCKLIQKREQEWYTGWVEITYNPTSLRGRTIRYG